MATKQLAETINKTVIIIHKPFLFSKNCVSSLSVTSTNLEGMLVMFFFSFHFTTLAIGTV